MTFEPVEIDFPRHHAISHYPLRFTGDGYTLSLLTASRGTFVSLDTLRAIVAGQRPTLIAPPATQTYAFFYNNAQALLHMAEALLAEKEKVSCD